MAVELGAIAGLMLLAFALRWPDFLYIPAFTDETRDTARAALISQGRLQTPVTTSPYISSLFDYLVAGLFVLFGPWLYLPRLLALVFGCLTVGATYFLGRAWGGRWAGGLAALLLALNGTHILVNSHVAWSNSITPFFTTLGLWQLTGAVGRGDGRALCLATIALTLGLLTHPSVLFLLPACTVYVLWKRPSLVRSRWPWIGLGCAVLLFSPMVLYDLNNDGEILRRIGHQRDLNTGGGPLTAHLYLGFLGSSTVMLVRTMAGAVADRGDLWRWVVEPGWLLWLGLSLAALILLARRGQPLPLMVVVSSLLIGALQGSDTFEPIFQGRYLMPAAVAGLAGLATGVVTMASACPLPARARIGLALCVTLFLGISLAVWRTGYVDDAPNFNRSLVALVEVIERTRAPEEVIPIDGRLHDRVIGGGWRTDRALEMALTVRDIPFRLGARLNPDGGRALVEQRPGSLAVLDRDNVERLNESLVVTRLASLLADPTPSGREEHGLYRLTARR